MKRSGGFTLVEILITITVMGILLAFAIVSLTGSLTKARDDDRTTDVVAIAKRLEGLYKVGFTGTSFTVTQGTYPSASQMRSASNRDEIFKDFNLSGRTVSGVTSGDSIVAPNPGTGDTIAYVPADVNKYAYIPLAVDGSGNVVICDNELTQDCRRFVIRYRLETAGGAVQADVRSKNQ